MDLGTYLSTIESATSFADRLGKTAVQISHWKTGFRPVPIEHCAEIEKITNGLVSRKDLRPVDWHRIWPELLDRKDAPVEPETSESGHVS